MNISIQRSCYEQMLLHCHTAYPEEACGVLLGIKESSSQNNIRITACIAITNIHHQKKVAFQFSPEQWVDAFYTAQRQGLAIVAIYHSHPSSDPQPSSHDLKGLIDNNMLYTIVSLKQKDSPQIRIYQLSGQNQFINYPLVLT